MTDNQPTDKWSRYWAGNRVSACMQEAEGQFKGNYAGSIGQHWQQFFSQLTAHSKVLDLATGNGAVLHFALDVARQNDLALDLTGVDLAAIQPWSHLNDEQLGASSLEFIPEVNITNLPFDAEQFDAVVSQYGAEYAPLAQVVAESARVMKPGGQLQWISHSTDSSVYLRSCTEIEDADFMLQHARPAEYISTLLKLQANGEYAAIIAPEAHQATANTIQRRDMDTALHACMQRLKQRPQSEILQHSLQNLAYIYQHRSQFALQLVLEKLSEWQLEVRLYQERLQALVDAAMDAQACNEFESLCSQAGLHNVSMSPIRKADGAIIGTLFKAHR